MKKLWILTLILCTSLPHFAQYTDIINSKRPGNSESPYSVGTDVLQIEGGVFFGQSDSDDTWAIVDPVGISTFIRYSKFMERLEVNANITYASSKLQFNNIFKSYRNISGISELTVGAKYLIYQQEYADKSKEIRSWKKRTEFDKKRLIPSVAAYVGLNTNFLSEGYKMEKISPKAAILLQNDFTDRTVVLTNLIADYIGTERSVYSYIITLTHALNMQWSVFVENQGDFYGFKSEFEFGAGAAYLYSPDLQLDVALRGNFSQVDSGFTAGLGASYRFDWHEDQMIEVDENGQKAKKKEGGFFSKLFKKKKK
ncbi:hypothetical protein KH5_22060 [Urechidicola sp. KH5]